MPSLGLRVADRRDLRLRRVTLTGSLAAALTRLPVGAHQRADGVHQERALDHRARAQRPHGRVSHRVAGGAIGSAKPSIRQHEPQALADEDLLSALFVLHQAQLWGFDDAVFSWEGLPELVFFQLDLESQFELALERLHWRMPPYTGDVAKQVLCMRALADAAVRRRSEATLRRLGEYWLTFASYLDVYWLRVVGHPASAQQMLAKSVLDHLVVPPREHRVPDIGSLPASVLASVNYLSLVGLHRRHRFALLGHMAATAGGQLESVSRVVQRLPRSGLSESSRCSWAPE